MTPEMYIEQLRNIQRTLDEAKDDLDRAIYKMDHRIETGYEHMEKESRLAALAAQAYVDMASRSIYAAATSEIEY